MRIFLPLILAALVFGCARAENPEVDAAVEAYRRAERIPGIALVVMRGDRVLIERGYGTIAPGDETPVTPQSVQPLFSVSKHMAAALVLSLVGEGRLNLDDPVAVHLPEWFADEPNLRVSHLLRQTSGLPDFTVLRGVEALEADPNIGMEDFIDLADGAPRRFAPGARYAYSNTNYTALALIAERVGGAPFADLQRARLFTPLGLALDECAAATEQISRGNDDEGEAVVLPANLAGHAGGGGVCGGARDLARWMRALAANGGAGYAPLIALEPTGAGYTPPYGFGLSTLPVLGRPAISHSGVDEGWTAYVAHLPEEDITIAITANRGWLFITDLAAPILRAILEAPAPSLAREPLAPGEREVLNGRFEDGLFTYRIRASADEVRVRVSAFPEEIVLHKQADGRILAADHPDTFALTLIPGPGVRPQIAFDWMEHRSFLAPAR